VIDSVNIGGLRFDVVIRDIDEFGRMMFDDRKIVLSRACSSDKRLFIQTLRHEMMHAALHLGGVAFAERYDDEAVVRCLENLFFPAWDELQALHRRR
jgi:hypothetical protein